MTIPGLLRKDGKVRLFYMGALELYREGTPNPLLVSWPTAEMRTGDFSKLVDGAGTPIKIYDPTTATYDANGNVTSPRLQFPNNTIPTPRLNPVAVAVTKFMPLPNQATVAGFRYGTNNLSLPGYFDKDKFYNLALKFDWNFGDKHRAFFRHASNDRTEDRSVNGLDNVPGTDGQQPFQRINDAYVIDWVSTFGPTTLVNIRSSFNRFIEKGYGAANANFDLTKLGVSPALIASLPNPDKAYFGRWNFDNGYNSLGRSQSNNYTNTYQLSGSVTKVRGSHSFKAGIDVRQINYLIQNTGDLLSYTGQNTWTANAFTGASSVTGDGYASFLLGDVSGSSNYPLFPWWKQWYYAPYLNDDWKVTRRLTLNLGIRWDFLTPQYEKWARQNGPFDASAATSIAAAVAANVTALGSQLPASIAANLSNLKGGLTFAGVNGVGQNPFPVQRNAIQPRVGFAYQLRDRLVIRGGFGEYFSDPTNDYQRTSGFSTSTSITNSLDNGRTPIANILSNPYPNGLLKPTGASLGTATFVGQNPSWFDPGFQIPSVWQFSLGFQYRTSANATIEVSYVGSRSYNLNMQKDTNVIPLSVRKACDFIEGGDARVCSAQLPNPFKGVAAFNGTSFYTSNTLSYGQLSRPFPQFNGNVTQLGRNDSFITYNSLQINYNWRTNKGVTFMANYTLSKQIEEWGFNDVQQGVYQQGPYTLDRPQILKFSSVWALPFGQGQRFGSNVHGFLNKLISGWEANGFFVDPLSGYPANLPGNAILLKDPRTPGGGFTGDVNWKGYVVREWNPCVLRATDNSGTGGAAATVAPTPNSLALGCGTDPANYAWLMTGANTPARFLPFRSGNIRVHHAVQLDFSILKRTQITERTSAQLGFEAFNILNHNYFGRDNVNTDPTSLNFGAVVPSIVSTQNILPRQIQVRFKFNW